MVKKKASRKLESAQSEHIAGLTDHEFRKWLTARLQVDKALEPDDERYQPLYQGVAGDPIELLYQDIDLSEVESLNFISGFRGSGKTTELFRLRKKLTDEKYFVAYANALDYLLPSEEIEISDFLLVLAGAFSDAIEKDAGVDPAKEGFWTRFVNFLTKTDVKLDGFDLKATAPGTDVGLNFKTSLKQTPSFRQQLRQKLTGRLGELRKEVHEFFEFGRKKIRESNPDTDIVFIFDQFEQLRDTLDTKGRVAESVTSLFANHRSDLRIPLFHMIFTVPPWLKFKLPELRSIRLLYSVKLWKNNAKRTRAKDGWTIMRAVVEKRFTEEGLVRFFGEPDAKGAFKRADELIKASGGHFRDLLRLLKETVLRARTMPVTKEITDDAIATLRDSFLPVSLRDARLLHDIGRHRNCLLQDDSQENVQRMTLFLDTHCAIILRNGEDWYDVHPLLRDEVARIVSDEEKRQAE